MIREREGDQRVYYDPWSLATAGSGRAKCMRTETFKGDRNFFPELENNRLVSDRFISSNLPTFIEGMFILEFEIGMFQPMHVSRCNSRLSRGL